MLNYYKTYKGTKHSLFLPCFILSSILFMTACVEIQSNNHALQQIAPQIPIEKVPGQEPKM